MLTNFYFSNLPLGRILVNNFTASIPSSKRYKVSGTGPKWNNGTPLWLSFVMKKILKGELEKKIKLRFAVY